MKLLLQEIVLFLACSVIVLLAAGCLGAVAWKFCRWLPTVELWSLRRSTITALMAVAAVAAILAQKGDRGTGVPPETAPQTGTTGASPVENELTNTLHFAAIDVHTNGTATLTVAWPTSLLPATATLDLFAATSLVDSVWDWQCEHQVAAGDTNWIVTVALPEAAPGTNAPSAFFRVSNRETCADTMDDSDGDGLINLHEYWCGTHPLVPDGSNTMLSVASRSIDDRIKDVDPTEAVPRFVNYFVNGSNGVFQLNTNFWARDLDLSCVSVWHSGDNRGSKAATLITRKHVVMAAHWASWDYVFCDTNGQICTRTISRIADISDDLRLGQLNTPLPDSFKPASVMSTNYVRYISAGKYLPTLCLNQEKGATVLELEDLNCRVLETGRGWHSQYGKNSMTNYVSVQRTNIRGTTPGGNSGCPVFLVVGNELVLLFSKHLGSHTEDRWCHFWGPTLSFRLESIQNKINEWEGLDAGQFQLVPFDLSTYPELVNQR